MRDHGSMSARLLLWLGERIVPERLRDELLGDLVEEACRRGPVEGRLWFLAQLALSAPALTLWRIRRASDGRHGAAQLGVLLALLWFAADRLLGAPAAWVAFGLVGALYNGAAAVLMWKRTPFRLLASVTALAAAESLAIAALVMAFPPEQVFASPLFWIAAGLSLAIYAGAWLWSRRSAPVAWGRWTEAAEETGIPGFLLLRHIDVPDRDTHTPA